MTGRWRTVVWAVASAVVFFVVLTVLSLVLAHRQDRLVCDAILDNRQVLAALVEARRDPVDPARFDGDLAAALVEMQARADEFSETAAAVLNTAPECAQ